MHAVDLELCTTRELIEELVRRQTFLGVIVHAEEEFKSRHWNRQRRFKVLFNANLSTEQACGLLDRVSEHMDENS